MSLPTILRLALIALPALAACQPAPRSDDAVASQPTKVEPEADPHAAAGNAVPQDEAEAGRTPPPAKGGY